MDGHEGRLIEFDIRVPVADEGLVSNVRHALSLGLPEVTFVPGSEVLTVIANGPTARHAPLDGSTLAVNGALGLFTERDLAPTYWAACDPQEVVAEFVRDAPPETTYLVASKCHPSVFEALKGRKVMLWHVDDHATWSLVRDRDPVMSGVSVTICAFELMRRLGFDRFETWGWDGCLTDGQTHAVPQCAGGLARTVEVGERRFESTTTWALEAQDAWDKLRDLPIAINGGGMIGEIFDFRRAA